MHDEEQQLQSQQPNRKEPLDPQLLSRVKQIIARIGHPPARVEVIGGDFLEYDRRNALREMD